MHAVPRLTLLEVRTLLGWSQARLADEAGVKTTAISDIEIGRTQNPGYVSVHRIVGALQKPLPGLKVEDVFPIPVDEESKAVAS